jgi:hypothetical protein
LIDFLQPGVDFSFTVVRDNVRIPHAWIVRVEIVGGFYPRVLFEFVDDLNALFGDKGTGKSTVLDITRYGCGCEGEWTDDAASRVAANLGGGLVTVTFETAAGVRYVLCRKWAEEKERQPPIVLTADGHPANVPLSMFRVLAFSQTELERTATNPAAQLALIDMALPDEVRRLDERIPEVAIALQQSAADILRLEQEVAVLQARAAEAESIEAELGLLVEAEGPDAERVQRAHVERGLRERELQALRGVEATVTGAADAVAALLTSARSRFALALEEELLQGPNGDLLAPIANGLRRTLDAFESLATAFGAEAKRTLGVIDTQRAELGARHAAQDRVYSELLALQQEHTSRATERARQQQRYAEVAGAKRELEQRTAELRSLQRAREDRAREFVQMGRRVGEARVKAARELEAKVGDKNVQIVPEQAGERSEYIRALQGGLTSVSGKPQALASKLAEALMPSELVAAVHQNDPERVRKAKVVKKQAQLIVEALCQQPATLLALQAVRLQDKITIQVKQGKHFKGLDKASPGQRASALLPIMLLASNVPLLIDQPEDHVSAQFLAGPGADMILARSGHQQTLFGTINSNVIILGRAGKVFKLECPDGEVGVIAREGPPHVLREEILELEGGRRAFEARRDFYDGKGDEG